MKKVLICGYGSIGRKHAINLKNLSANIKIWRSRSNVSDDIQQDGFTFEPSLEKGLSWCDAVVIATATDKHIDILKAAADLKKSIYLEKPVSHNRDGVDEILAKGDLMIEVGCQLRHHPGIHFLRQTLLDGKDGPVLTFQAWVGQRLDQWRPGTDYRIGYSADASRGGGALFDLVHEIDLIALLAGKIDSVSADLRTNSDLEMKAEDLANLLLVTKKGAAGMVQLDMLSPAYRRGLILVCAKAVYNWDFTKGCVWRDEGKGPVCIHEVASDFAPRDLLYLSMQHFLRRMDDSSLPASCSFAEAVHDLDILLAARRSSMTGQREFIS